MAAQAMFSNLPAELPPPSMADILMNDHRETMVLLNHFNKVSKSGDTQMMENLTDAIAMVIRLHSEGEYQTLYPFMEKTMGKKESHVSECLEEHHKIEREVMEAIELRKQGGDELTDAVDAVFKDFETHMKHEEDEWVVALLEEASEADLQEVAVNFMQAKETAPLDPQTTA